MLVKFKDYMKARNDPERIKQNKEKRNKKLIITKQKVIEQFETKQKWNIIFGKEKPKNIKIKELPKFMNITYRNIWMEENFLYQQAVSLNPGEVLHPCEEYVLEWVPPNSSLRVMIRLDDQKAQSDTLKRISYYPLPIQNQIIFYFTTISKNKNLFGEKIHPSANESYHDRPSVLRKICEKYMTGVLSLADFNMILEAGYSTWKLALYNLLDEEERSYHPYLLDPPPKVSKKSLERQYLDDNITLQQYEDLKFPVRKAKKDEEALSYPRPYTYGKCIICKEEDVAVVKCLHCNNLTCPSCVTKVFLDNDTSEGCFLLLHRRYCARLGAFPVTIPEIAPEPACLRELRMTGYLAAQKRHSDMYLSEEERRRLLEEEARKHDEEEKESSSEEGSVDDQEEDEEMVRLEVDNEPTILKFVTILTSCNRKMEGAVPELKKMHTVLDNPQRGATVRERIQRMKNEKVSKLERTLVKVAKCRKKLNPFMKLKRVSAPVDESFELEEVLRRVLSVTTWAEYEEIERNLEQQQKARESASLMSTMVM